MSSAVAVLLDHWQRVQVQGNTITVATPEQLEAHDKQFIHQYPGGSFDAGKALEYIFNKSNETIYPEIDINRQVLMLDYWDHTSR